MREGGVRRVLVPGALAYGQSGMSRYDAYRLGFANPVPRGETIRYEVEILRCRDVDLDVLLKTKPSEAEGGGAAEAGPGGSDTPPGSSPTRQSRQCCSDLVFPCT